jgi:hypothetical protein
MVASYGGPQGILAPSFDPAERAGGVTALEGEWNLLKQQLHSPELAAAPRQDSHRIIGAPAETQAEPEAAEAAEAALKKERAEAEAAKAKATREKMEAQKTIEAATLEEPVVALQQREASEAEPEPQTEPIANPDSQSSTEEGVPPPTLDSVPPEVRQLLLTMLSVASLGRLAATSKDWERACAAPAVWLPLLQRDFPEQVSQLDDAAAAPVEMPPYRAIYRAALEMARAEAEAERSAKAAAEAEVQRVMHEMGDSGLLPGSGRVGGGFMQGGDFDRHPGGGGFPGGPLGRGGGFGGGLGMIGGGHDIMPGGGFGGELGGPGGGPGGRGGGSHQPMG